VHTGTPNTARPLAERPLKSYGGVNEDARKREMESTKQSVEWNATVHRIMRE